MSSAIMVGSLGTPEEEKTGWTLTCDSTEAPQLPQIALDSRYNIFYIV